MTQSQALKILKSGANVFLTGEPGSGKTYVINQYVTYLRSHGIQPAITASTGIAATHIGGMTIHSWSGIGIKDRLNKTELRSIVTNDYVSKRVKAAKVLIIDEVSMLAPQTLQMIDAICRGVRDNSKSFGGLQVVLVGDFFQLPPINKNFADESSQENLFDEEKYRFVYDSPIWNQTKFTTCYITEQHRQDDSDLVSILTKIRNNSFDELSLSHIKKRKIDLTKVPDNVPKLYSHNIDVDAVNNRMLAKIPAKARYFNMTTKGSEAIIRAMKKGCLSPENLYLKVGASVMFTKNNSKDGYVNGTLGVVDGFNKETGLPIIKLRNGRKIKVNYADWTIENNGNVRGRLSQIPLRLAWAITVHKSQGISLDEAVIDLSKVFEFGQGYVAISRVKRISGVYLLGWNEMAFQVNSDVLKKDQDFYNYSADAEMEFSQFCEEEISKQHKDFIINCEGQIDIIDVKYNNKKKKISTHDETLKLWNDGLEIKQIAKERGLVQKTILGHIEELVNNGKIKRSELLRIVPPDLLSGLPKIQAVFKKLDTRKLSLVFDYFQGKYSYDDLKLARMLMD